MKGLAKLGFAQSFSYFPWRTAKAELEQYLGRALARAVSGRTCSSTRRTCPYHLLAKPGCSSRALRWRLVGDCSASVRGFELLEHEAVPGREEYQDYSDKYQIRQRDWADP